MMKKLMLLGLAGIMCVGLMACGTSAEKKTEAPEETHESTEESTGDTIVNPVTEMSEEEMVEKTGIDLPTPEGATNVTYSVIDTDEAQIAQMTFTLDGHEFTERACATAMTSLLGDALTDMFTDPENLVNLDVESGNISGLYYEWTSFGTQLVSNRDAYALNSDEGPCFIAWLDTVPGILYNLDCNDALESDELVTYAEQVFVPMQGEAG